MRLIYTANPTREVKIGDTVEIDGTTFTVTSFRKPHKPASSGKVSVRWNGPSTEFYVGVIGAEWVEREDREADLQHFV
jgi:hypothetical protein